MVTIEAKATKWLALALLVSVGANMFLGGLLAGRYAGARREPPAASAPDALAGAVQPAPGQPGVGPLRRMAAVLPENQRPVFEQPFIDRRRELMQANLTLREARLRLRDAIIADPLDRARVERSFAELRARNDEVQRLLHAAGLEAIARLPAESRQRIADWAQPRQLRQQRGPGGGSNAPGARP